MKKLEAQLKELKTVSKPRKDAKAALWSKLDAEFEQTYPSTVFVFRRVVAVPLAVLIVFVSTGVGVYAYASPSVTQEHTLYPVKRGIESMEAAIPRSPRGAVQFHTRMMERRLAEGMYMHHRQELHAAILDEIAKEFTRALQEMESVDDEIEVRVVIFEQIGEQTSDYGELLEALIAEQDGDFQKRRERVRNNFNGVRVQISESTLDDDEKQELLYRLEFDRDAPRSFDFEFELVQ